MNRATSILSSSALAHLIVFDLVFYFLSPGVEINFFVMLTYNISWIIIALYISTRAYKKTERKY